MPGLSGADLSWSDLTGATLIQANLDDADLYGAKLAHTNLIRASVEGMNEGPRRWAVGRSYERHDRQPEVPEAAQEKARATLIILLP